MRVVDVDVGSVFVIRICVTVIESYGFICCVDTVDGRVAAIAVVIFLSFPCYIYGIVHCVVVRGMTLFTWTFAFPL